MSSERRQRAGGDGRAWRRRARRRRIAAYRDGDVQSRARKVLLRRKGRIGSVKRMAFVICFLPSVRKRATALTLRASQVRMLARIRSSRFQRGWCDIEAAASGVDFDGHPATGGPAAGFEPARSGRLCRPARHPDSAVQPDREECGRAERRDRDTERLTGALPSLHHLDVDATTRPVALTRTARIAPTASALPTGSAMRVPRSCQRRRMLQKAISASDADDPGSEALQDDVADVVGRHGRDASRALTARLPASARSQSWCSCPEGTGPSRTCRRG